MGNIKTDEIAALSNSLRPRLDAVLICLSNAWGGLEQVASEDARDLVRLGLRVKFMCSDGSPVHSYLSDLKPGDRPVLLPVSYKPRNYFDMKMRADINDWIKSGINLIHTHQTSLLGSISPWLWWKKNVAFFATRHMLSRHDKRDFLHHAVFARLDAMLVMSEALRRNVLNTHPIGPERVKIVNLGLSLEKFDTTNADPSPQRKHFGVEQDELAIGMVGRIDPAKGQATFIKAAAGLLKDGIGKPPLKFIIVGEETRGSSKAKNHVAELKCMVEQLKIGEYVLLAGFMDNIPEVMQAFDIVVMPSRQETFGLVAIEAMAMERPIVISSGGSASEIVGDNERGLVMRPEDAFDLQLQLRRLIAQPELRAEMGRRAREYVISNYNRNKRVLETLRLYDSSLSRRKFN
ncbi:MAG: glycosyltransferase family 4 protein [Bdellovibrionota bacterium]